MVEDPLFMEWKKLIPDKILGLFEDEKTSFFRKFLEVFGHISRVAKRNRLKPLLNTINSICGYFGLIKIILNLIPFPGQVSKD